MPFSDQFHNPKVEVRIGNATEGFALAKPIDLTIDYGLDLTSASCTLLLAERPEGLNLLQQVEVSLGWFPYLSLCFKGFIEDDGRRFFPFGVPIRAVGELRKTQKALGRKGGAPQASPIVQYGPASPVAATRTLATDGAIVRDLVTRAGVEGTLDIADTNTPFGVLQPVTLRPGGTPAEVIGEVDKVTRSWTTNTRDGRTMRRQRPIRPTGTSAWSYTEGINLLEFDRPRSVQEAFNAVYVRGRPRVVDSAPDDPAATPTVYTTEAYREGSNVFVQSPPGIICFDFSSDYLESQPVVDALADALLIEKGVLPDPVTITVAGNPFVDVGSTVTLLAPHGGITAPTPYLVVKLQHKVGERWETRLDCLGFPQTGDTSLLNGEAPIPQVAWTRTTATDGSVTVTGDASGTIDPSGDATLLEFAWAASAGVGDTQSGATFSVTFTAAEVAAGPTIHLTVRAPDGSGGFRTGSATYPVSVIG